MKSRKRVRDWEHKGDELKAWDTNIDNEVVSPDGNWIATILDPDTYDTLSAPEVGAASNQRVGRRIRIKSIQIGGCARMQATVLAEDPPGFGQVLVALVLDTQTNGAQMRGEDVYETRHEVGLLSIPELVCTPARVLAGMSRYKVLKKVLLDFPQGIPVRKRFDESGEALYNQAPQTLTFQINLELDLEVAFNSDEFSVAGVTDNSLHVIACRNSTAGSCRLYYISRIRYVG